MANRKLALGGGTYGNVGMDEAPSGMPGLPAKGYWTYSELAGLWGIPTHLVDEELEKRPEFKEYAKSPKMMLDEARASRLGAKAMDPNAFIPGGDAPLRYDDLPAKDSQAQTFQQDVSSSARDVAGGAWSGLLGTGVAGANAFRESVTDPLQTYNDALMGGAMKAGGGDFRGGLEQMAGAPSAAIRDAWDQFRPALDKGREMYNQLGGDAMLSRALIGAGHLGSTSMGSNPMIASGAILPGLMPVAAGAAETPAVQGFIEAEEAVQPFVRGWKEDAGLDPNIRNRWAEASGDLATGLAGADMVMDIPFDVVRGGSRLGKEAAEAGVRGLDDGFSGIADDAIDLDGVNYQNDGFYDFVPDGPPPPPRNGRVDWGDTADVEAFNERNRLTNRNPWKNENKPLGGPGGVEDYSAFDKFADEYDSSLDTEGWDYPNDEIAELHRRKLREQYDAPPDHDYRDYEPAYGELGEGVNHPDYVPERIRPIDYTRDMDYADTMLRREEYDAVHEPLADDEWAGIEEALGLVPGTRANQIAIGPLPKGHSPELHNEKVRAKTIAKARLDDAGKGSAAFWRRGDINEQFRNAPPSHGEAQSRGDEWWKDPSESVAGRRDDVTGTGRADEAVTSPLDRESQMEVADDIKALGRRGYQEEADSLDQQAAMFKEESFKHPFGSAERKQYTQMAADLKAEARALRGNRDAESNELIDEILETRRDNAPGREFDDNMEFNDAGDPLDPTEYDGPRNRGGRRGVRVDSSDYDNPWEAVEEYKNKTERAKGDPTGVSQDALGFRHIKRRPVRDKEGNYVLDEKGKKTWEDVRERGREEETLGLDPRLVNQPGVDPTKYYKMTKAGNLVPATRANYGMNEFERTRKNLDKVTESIVDKAVKTNDKAYLKDQLDKGKGWFNVEAEGGIKGPNSGKVAAARDRVVQQAEMFIAMAQRQLENASPEQAAKIKEFIEKRYADIKDVKGRSSALLGDNVPAEELPTDMLPKAVAGRVPRHGVTPEGKWKIPDIPKRPTYAEAGKAADPYGGMSPEEWGKFLDENGDGNWYAKGEPRKEDYGDNYYGQDTGSDSIQGLMLESPEELYHVIRSWVRDLTPHEQVELFDWYKRSDDHDLVPQYFKKKPGRSRSFNSASSPEAGAARVEGTPQTADEWAEGQMHSGKNEMRLAPEIPEGVKKFGKRVVHGVKDMPAAAVRLVDQTVRGADGKLVPEDVREVFNYMVRDKVDTPLDRALRAYKESPTDANKAHIEKMLATQDQPNRFQEPNINEVPAREKGRSTIGKWVNREFDPQRAELKEIGGVGKLVAEKTEDAERIRETLFGRWMGDIETFNGLSEKDAHIIRMVRSNKMDKSALGDPNGTLASVYNKVDHVLNVVGDMRKEAGIKDSIPAFNGNMATVVTLLPKGEQKKVMMLLAGEIPDAELGLFRIKNRHATRIADAITEKARKSGRDPLTTLANAEQFPGDRNYHISAGEEWVNTAKRENYWPGKSGQKTNVDHGAAHHRRAGGQRGNQIRLGEDPVALEHPKITLANYLDEAARLIAEAQTFGFDGSPKMFDIRMQQLVAAARKNHNPQDAATIIMTAKRFFNDIWLAGDTRRAFHQVARTGQVLAKMTKAAIQNATGNWTTMEEFGPKAFGKAIMTTGEEKKAATRSTHPFWQDYQAYHRDGLETGESLVVDMGNFLADLQSKVTGYKGVEGALRPHASIAGEIWADEALKLHKAGTLSDAEDAANVRKLRDMRVSPESIAKGEMTADEREAVRWYSSYITQHGMKDIDRPYLQTALPELKTASLFMSWPSANWQVHKRSIKRALETKKVGPIFAGLAMAGISGEVYNNVKDMISARSPAFLYWGENAEKVVEDTKLMLDGTLSVGYMMEKYGAPATARIFLDVIASGYAAKYMQFWRYGKFSNPLGGPYVDDFTKGIPNAMSDDPKEERKGLRQLFVPYQIWNDWERIAKREGFFKKRDPQTWMEMIYSAPGSQFAGAPSDEKTEEAQRRSVNPPQPRGVRSGNAPRPGN